MCARPFALPVWLSKSASHWPGDGNTLPGVFEAMRAISRCMSLCGLCQCPAAIPRQIVSDSPCQHLASEGASASSSGLVREASTGHAKLVRSCQRDKISQPGDLQRACVFVPDVCGLRQRPAAIPRQIVSDSPCQYLSSEGVPVSSQLVWFGQRGTHWACQVRQILPERQTSQPGDLQRAVSGARAIAVARWRGLVVSGEVRAKGLIKV